MASKRRYNKTQKPPAETVDILYRDILSNSHRHLSNPLILDGVAYHSVDNLLFASTLKEEKDKLRSAGYRPEDLERNFKTCERVSSEREILLEKALRMKFDYAEMRAVLMQTGDAELRDGSAHNELGKLLTKLREELKEV